MPGAMKWYILLILVLVLGKSTRADPSEDIRQSLSARLGVPIRVAKVSVTLGDSAEGIDESILEELGNTMVLSDAYWDQSGPHLFEVYSFWLGRGSILAAYRPSKDEFLEAENARALLFRRRNNTAILKGITSWEARPQVVRYFLSLDQTLNMLSQTLTSSNESELVATSLLEAAANEGPVKKALASILKDSAQSPEQRRAKYLGDVDAIISGKKTPALRYSEQPELWRNDVGWQRVDVQSSSGLALQMEVKRVKISRVWFKEEYFSEDFWYPVTEPQFPFHVHESGTSAISRSLSNVPTEFVLARKIQIKPGASPDVLLGADPWMRPTTDDAMLLGVVVKNISREPNLKHPYYRN